MCVTLAGCDERAPVEPPIRTVKLGTLQDAEGGAMSFIGSVRRSERAQLSFEQTGRVQKVGVEVGDNFKRGDVLAVLDPVPFQQQLIQARAKVQAAGAALAQRNLQFAQQQAMFDDGSIAKVTLVEARAALTAAQSDLNVAEADLQLARRASERSVIRAPFDGQVTTRHVEPFDELAAGQAALDVQGSGASEVSADVSMSMAAAIKAGATVTASQENGRPVPLTVRSIAEHESTSGTVAVLFEASPDAGQLRPGAVASIVVHGRPVGTVKTLPLTSVLPDQSQGSGSVFVYVPKSTHVKKVAVRLGAFQGGRVEILSGLDEGSQIVVAGASYLSDGQRVRPFQSDSKLGDVQQ